MNYQKYFNENGYVIIPNILNKDEVAEVRAKHTELIKSNHLKTVPPTKMYPILEHFVLKPNITSSIKSILNIDEILFMYPNFTIRESVYLSFHNDSFFLPEEIESQLESTEFLQCAIYLQNNNKGAGGGVSVIPETHTITRQERSIITQEVNNTPDIAELRATTVASNAGDLVIWDARLIHSSTKFKDEPIQKKLALQWSVSKSDSYKTYFINYLKKRSKEELHVSDYESERPLSYFLDMLNIKENNLPSSVKEALEQQNIKLITLNLI